MTPPPFLPCRSTEGSHPSQRSAECHRPVRKVIFIFINLHATEIYPETIKPISTFDLKTGKKAKSQDADGLKLGLHVPCCWVFIYTFILASLNIDVAEMKAKQL